MAYRKHVFFAERIHGTKPERAQVNLGFCDLATITAYDRQLTTAKKEERVDGSARSY